MGMRTTASAAAMVRAASPSPSVPSTTATRESGAVQAGEAAKSSRSTASSLRARAATVKPARRSSPGSGQALIRVQGTWKTVPMDTRTLRR